MSFTRGGSGTGPGSKFGTEWIIDSQRGAQRASISPLDYSDINGNVLGYYAAMLKTGNIAATLAAASPLGSFRWTAPNALALILRIAWAWQHVTASATQVAGFPDADAILARSFTGVDSGGTAITAPAKMRSLMGNSLVNDLRVAGTAALTAGTRTLDATAFAFASAQAKVSPDIGATAATAVPVGIASPMVDLYKWDRLGGHPPVLQANEGLILRNVSAGPAAGTFNYIFVVEWAELANF